MGTDKRRDAEFDERQAVLERGFIPVVRHCTRIIPQASISLNPKQLQSIFLRLVIVTLATGFSV